MLWKTLEGDSGNAMANLALASVALARGQGHAEALAFYRERWPGLFRAAPEVGPVNAAAALGVAVLLVDSGQGAEVEKLLESIEREGVSFWPSAVVIARA
ncbi:MAG: hypothetical protein GTO04_19650, partial [Planctomycetales bacterium]|nr:hypothetical protein [Planctomycetales bacterium]